VLLYRYSVSQSSEFCRHNPLCCFSTSVYCCCCCCCCCCLFRYRLSSETFGYTLVHSGEKMEVRKVEWVALVLETRLFGCNATKESSAYWIKPCPNCSLKSNPNNGITVFFSYSLHYIVNQLCFICRNQSYIGIGLFVMEYFGDSITKAAHVYYHKRSLGRNMCC
jgi:hypothetical protein